MKNEQLFSESRAAEFFGWSVFTMREIRKRGEIKCLIFNNKTVRYTLEQLQDYKEAHLVGGSSANQKVCSQINISKKEGGNNA